MDGPDLPEGSLVALVVRAHAVPLDVLQQVGEQGDLVGEVLRPEGVRLRRVGQVAQDGQRQVAQVVWQGDSGGVSEWSGVEWSGG